MESATLPYASFNTALPNLLCPKGRVERIPSDGIRGEIHPVVLTSGRFVTKDAAFCSVFSARSQRGVR